MIRNRFAVAAAAVAALAASSPPAHATVGPDGAFTTDIPIAVPAFYGLEPDLRLVYSSHAGNGWLGVGWSLTGISEIRRTAPGYGAPHYDGDDIFLLDGMELVPCEGAAPSTPLAASPSCKYKQQPNHLDFATRIESFARIALEPPTGLNWFVWDRDGTKRTYRAQLATGFSVTPALAWHLERVEDTVGHVVAYSYRQSADPLGAGDEYLDKITYGDATVTFYTEPRPDPIVAATGDSLLLTRERLKTIDVSVSGKRVRAYALRYETHRGTGRSVLTEVQEYGRDAELDASGGIIAGTAFPPNRMSYGNSSLNIGWSPAESPSSAPAPGWDGVEPDNVFRGITQEIERGYGALFHAGDFDGDGRTDGLLTILSPSADTPELNLSAQLATGAHVHSTIVLPPRSRRKLDRPSPVPPRTSSRDWARGDCAASRKRMPSEQMQLSICSCRESLEPSPRSAFWRLFGCIRPDLSKRLRSSSIPRGSRDNAAAI